MRVAVVFVVLSLACGSLSAREPNAPTAEAQATARTHFEMGRRHHELGDYLTAVEEFKKAYLAAPMPLFLFNIGQSYRRANRPREAVEFYRRFLTMAPDAPERANVNRIIVELEAQQPAEATTTPAQVTPPPRPPEAIVAAPVEPAPSATSANPPRSRRRIGLILGITAGVLVVAAGATTAGVLLSRGGVEPPHSDLGNFTVFR